MKEYDIAAYVWPAYTGTEPRARIFWQEGKGEWQTVLNAKPKGEYVWGRMPLWGAVDEADPAVMEMQIEEATKHGVNVFIYDWYWYDSRPFLEQCLNDGFLKAKNRDKMKFYLMWANHDTKHLWDIRNSDDNTSDVWIGRVEKSQFDVIVDRVINNYFSQPNYYKIDGKPVFMIYDIGNLIKGLGGIDNTVKAFREFKEKTVKAGFKGLELQLTVWGNSVVNLSGIDDERKFTASDIVRQIPFDSITNYQFVHICDMNRDYLQVLEDVKKEWTRIDQEFSIPYYPHVSIGWDNNPRYVGFRDCICKNNTPDNFREALLAAKEYVDTHANLKAPLITINSWNEWTETSYLEPDNLYGYGYLQAIKDVFKKDSD